MNSVASVEADEAAHACELRCRLIGIVVPCKQKPAVLALVNEINPTAFVTVEDMRRVDWGYGRLAK